MRAQRRDLYSLKEQVFLVLSQFYLFVWIIRRATLMIHNDQQDITSEQRAEETIVWKMMVYTDREYEAQFFSILNQT